MLGVSRTAGWKQVRTAYLALARRYHPDGSSPDGQRMTEINAAYEELERQHLEATDDSRPLPPARSKEPASGPERGSLLWRMQTGSDEETPVLEFGPYAGKRIAEIARTDPRYLRWLSRQSSGIPYRRAIDAVLGSTS